MNVSTMNRGWAGLLCAVLMAGVLPAQAQMLRARTGPALPAAPGAAGAAAGAVKIKKLAPVKATTPVFEVKHGSTPTSRPKDWWCARMEFETGQDWTDELEVTTYVYVQDQSNKNAPLMFKDVTTYVDLEKGTHLAEVYLHPDTFKKVGIPKYVAVVIRVAGAVVATESTATTQNWWDQFTPVDGVLLPRSRTPFAVVDYDNYPCVKPEATRR